MRQHGTHARYVLGPNVDDQPGHGCRCDECRHANKLYERQRQRRVEPPYVGADRARDHILWLREQGVGLKTVAKRSGVAHGSLSKLMYGDAARGMGPSKRIRPATERAILSVTTVDALAGSRVPADETWRHINELVSRGWSKTAIARAIGQTGTGLQIGRGWVTRRNAAAIRALLDQPVQPRMSRHGTPVTTTPIAEVDDQDQVERADVSLPRLLDSLRQPWRARGACRFANVPEHIFFPGRGDNATLDAARRVCDACPVTAECLAWALEHGETGVWGGTSDAQRRAMRKTTAA